MTKSQCAAVRAAHCVKSRKQTKQTRFTMVRASSYFCNPYCKSKTHALPKSSNTELFHIIICTPSLHRRVVKGEKWYEDVLLYAIKLHDKNGRCGINLTNQPQKKRSRFFVNKERTKVRENRLSAIPNYSLTHQ